MLVPNDDRSIPELTAETARAAFPSGNVFMKIRDELGPIFEDEQFVDLYPSLGQPAASPGRLALVTVMQYVENLTDRQAADAVRGRINWKYALGLELSDPGFHYSVLSEFRARLVAGGAEQILLEKMLEQCQAKGLLEGKSKQRTDSTHIVAAIRQLNRLEMVGETMRRALDDLAQVAPDWLKPHIQPEWIERYGKRVDIYRLPKSKAKRDALAQAIGQDGHYVLTAIYDEATPAELRTLPSIETLRRVWVQQYYVDEDDTHWRTKKKWGHPPARHMIASPDEPDARYAARYSTVWTGYKVHLTETCDPDQPRLITHVETTPATTHDVKVTEKIHDDLTSKDLLPDEHFVDGGYLEADLLLSSHKKGIDLIGPMPADKSWQAKTEGAFDHSQFQIDWERMQATCPNGKTSIYQMEGATRRSSPNMHFTFSVTDCRPCPVRAKCTRAKAGGRTLTIYPREPYEILQAARERQSTEEFKVLYRTRAGIEGTISQAVTGMDIRFARYRGMAKTHLQNLATAAAINLVRVANWMMGLQPEPTRISPFTALALQT